MNQVLNSDNTTIIQKREDGYYVERCGIGKFFPISERVDWKTCRDLADAFAARLEVFTSVSMSLSEWKITFWALKQIVDKVEKDFPYEGVEGFAEGDFTYFADLSNQTIGVQFGALIVYLSNSKSEAGKFQYIVEIITGYLPKKTTVVCSGVSAETVVAIVRNSPRSQSYKEPFFKQLFFSPANMDFFNSVRLTD